MARSKSIKREVCEYLEAEHPASITGAVWKELLKRFAPVSESYLRDLLRQTGLPFEQPYAGVRQHTFEELEQSLRDLWTVYSAAAAAGDRDQARYCRRQVIAAKDRARFLAANPKTVAETQAEKTEMAQWMLVWLENPEVFPAWVDARKRAMGGAWLSRKYDLVRRVSLNAEVRSSGDDAEKQGKRALRAISLRLRASALNARSRVQGMLAGIRSRSFTARGLTAG